MYSMRTRRWTKEQLIVAVKESTSIRQVLFKLGLIEAGGNYEQIKKVIAEEKLEISHFSGKGWRRGRLVPKKPLIPLEHILVQESRFQSFKLKKRLFREGVRKPVC